MATVTKPASRPRVELQLHEHATLREYRELGVFVRDCIDRIERTLGRGQHIGIKRVVGGVDRLDMRACKVARRERLLGKPLARFGDGKVGKIGQRSIASRCHSAHSD